MMRWVSTVSAIFSPFARRYGIHTLLLLLLLLACSLNSRVSGCYRGHSMYREHYNGGLGGISGVEIGCV